MNIGKPRFLFAKHIQSIYNGLMNVNILLKLLAVVKGRVQFWNCKCAEVVGSNLSSDCGISGEAEYFDCGSGIASAVITQTRTHTHKKKFFEFQPELLHMTQAAHASLKTINDPLVKYVFLRKCALTSTSLSHVRVRWNIGIPAFVSCCFEIVL